MHVRLVTAWLDVALYTVRACLALMQLPVILTLRLYRRLHLMDLVLMTLTM